MQLVNFNEALRSIFDRLAHDEHPVMVIAVDYACIHAYVYACIHAYVLTQEVAVARMSTD